MKKLAFTDPEIKASGLGIVKSKISQRGLDYSCL
jgi:hypothetical protein